MKRVNWDRSEIQVPTVAMGCMRMADLSVGMAAQMIDTAMEEGVDFFDHADISLTKEEWYGIYMATGNILP